MKDRLKIIFAFVVSLAVLNVIAIFSIRNVKQYQNANYAVNKSKDIIFEALNVLSYLQSIETSHRGYIITGKTSYLPPRTNALNKIDKSLRRLNEITKGHDPEMRLADSLAYLTEMKISYSNEVIRAFDSAGFDVAQKLISLDNSKMVMDKARLIVNKILRTENDELTNLVQTGNSKFKDSLAIMSVAWGVSVIIILISMFLILRNLKRRINQQKQLRIYSQQLEVKNKELDQFVKVASHDLKEPMKTISNYTNYFKEEYSGEYDETLTRYLSNVSNATERMKILIEDLLEFTRLGNVNETVPVDLNEVMRDVILKLSGIIQANNAILNFNTLPIVNGYRKELVLLFENLIENAIKFKKPGDVAPEINITFTEEEHFWKFAIQDYGIGIEKKYSDKIFMIFQRLHDRKEYPGTGIGLALCSKIASMHGGKIWVDSEVNKGSTFYFTLRK